jgi:hypothetical protein
LIDQINRPISCVVLGNKRKEKGESFHYSLIQLEDNGATRGAGKKSERGELIGTRI